MLRDELLKFQEQIARQSRKQKRKMLGYFKEIQFNQSDWMQIKHLNDELKVSYHIIFTDVVHSTDNIATLAFQFSYQGNGRRWSYRCFSVGQLFSNDQRLEEEGSSWCPRKCLSSNVSQDDNQA